MLPSAESIQIVLPIVSILFLILGFYKPIYGVISYFIIINARLGIMYPELGAIRIELIAAIVIIAAIFISEKGMQNLLITNKITNALLILFFIGMLSVPQAVNVKASWEEGGYELIKIVLFYFMIVASIQDFSDLKKLVLAFVFMTLWTGYEPIANYLSGVVVDEAYGAVALGRYGAAAGHVALANTLNQGIPIAIFLMIFESKIFKKIIYGVIVSFLILGVIVSKSRGGFLGFLVIGFGIIYFTENKIRMLLYLVGVFIISLPIAGAQYIDHLSSIIDGIGGSRSSMDRYMGLVNGIDMILKRPLLGVGIGCFAEARSMYFNYMFESHNLYGELIGELGLGSIAWFYWMYLVFLRSHFLKKLLDTNIEKHNFYFNILTGIQLGLIVRLFLGNFTHGSLIWFWFLMAALVTSIENFINNDEDVVRIINEINDESDNQG